MRSFRVEYSGYIDLEIEDDEWNEYGEEDTIYSRVDSIINNAGGIDIDWITDWDYWETP